MRKVVGTEIRTIAGFYSNSDGAIYMPNLQQKCIIRAEELLKYFNLTINR